jgi:hypothetical protein
MMRIFEGSKYESGWDGYEKHLRDNSGVISGVSQGYLRGHFRSHVRNDLRLDLNKT